MVIDNRVFKTVLKIMLDMDSFIVIGFIIFVVP